MVDVLLNTEGRRPLPERAHAGRRRTVTFTVTFNRDMDQNIQPLVSFGPDVPMTDYTVHPVAGGWTDARTWADFQYTLTGDGYQLIRAAQAADDWLVTGDDAGRFRFRVETTGTAAMNLQATGGEGYVDPTRRKPILTCWRPNFYRCQQRRRLYPPQCHHHSAGDTQLSRYGRDPGAALFLQVHRRQDGYE